MIRQSSDFRENLENKFEEKIRLNEEHITAQKEALENEKTKIKEEFNSREKVLEEKIKDIDDRNNTHVRREIRDRMLDDVKARIENFGVSKATENKRRPVSYGIIFMILTLSCLMGFTGYEITISEKQYFSNLETIKNLSSLSPEQLKSASNGLIASVSVSEVDKTKIYWLWGRFVLFSISLLGSILYYIKWQNRWAEQHSNSEFQLQQFYIDVNRANWVIESCLEWRKDTKSTIPTDLLKSITNNLFTNDSSELEKVIHPADELASALMGSASNLKVKLGENEMSFDKPKKIMNKPLKPRTPVKANT